MSSVHPVVYTTTAPSQKRVGSTTSTLRTVQDSNYVTKDGKQYKIGKSGRRRRSHSVASGHDLNGPLKTSPLMPSDHHETLSASRLPVRPAQPAQPSLPARAAQQTRSSVVVPDTIVDSQSRKASHASHAPHHSSVKTSTHGAKSSTNPKKRAHRNKPSPAKRRHTSSSSSSSSVLRSRPHPTVLSVSSPPRVIGGNMPDETETRKRYRTHSEVMSISPNHPQTSKHVPQPVRVAPINPLVPSPFSPEGWAMRTANHPTIISTPPKKHTHHKDSSSSSSSSTSSSSPRVSVSSPAIPSGTKTKYSSPYGHAAPHYKKKRKVSSSSTVEAKPVTKKESRRCCGGKKKYSSSSSSLETPRPTSTHVATPVPHPVHTTSKFPAPAGSPVVPDRYQTSSPVGKRAKTTDKLKKSISISEEVHVINSSSSTSSSSQKTQPKKKSGCCGINRDHSASSSSISDDFQASSSSSSSSSSTPVHFKSKYTPHSPTHPPTALHHPKPVSSSTSSLSSEDVKKKNSRCGGCCGFCSKDEKADKQHSFSSSTGAVEPFVPPTGSAVERSMGKKPSRGVTHQNPHHHRQTSHTSYKASPTTWTTQYLPSPTTAGIQSPLLSSSPPRLPPYGTSSSPLQPNRQPDIQISTAHLNAGLRSPSSSPLLQ